jgi:flagellar basal-body rod protein FlgC
MSDPINTALSGLNAATQRLDVAAANIANSQDTAPLAPKPGQPKPYQPLDVVQSTAPGGGTQTSLRPVAPPSAAIFDPGSPFADQNGLVAAPNVDPARELVNASIAQFSYDANLKVIATARKTQGYLLDIFT